MCVWVFTTFLSLCCSLATCMLMRFPSSLSWWSSWQPRVFLFCPADNSHPTVPVQNRYRFSLYRFWVHGWTTEDLPTSTTTTYPASQQTNTISFHFAFVSAVSATIALARELRLLHQHQQNYISTGVCLVSPASTAPQLPTCWREYCRQGEYCPPLPSKTKGHHNPLMLSNFTPWIPTTTWTYIDTPVGLARADIFPCFKRSCFILFGFYKNVQNLTKNKRSKWI